MPGSHTNTIHELDARMIDSGIVYRIWTSFSFVDMTCVIEYVGDEPCIASTQGSPNRLSPRRLLFREEAEEGTDTACIWVAEFT